MTACNPFSAHLWWPGELPFVPGPDGVDADACWDRFVRAGYRGQIVGPKGSGKTTLLLDLLRRARHAGLSLEALAARGEASGPPRLSPTLPRSPGRPHVLVVESADRLSPLRRATLKARARLTGCGLLVTAHTDVGLPTLTQTAATPESAAAVISALTRDRNAPLPSRRSLETLLALHDGNLRLVLAALYDAWQDRPWSAPVIGEDDLR
jgi:hypothetical protein